MSDKNILETTNTIDIVLERPDSADQKVQILKVLNAKKYVHLKNYVASKMTMETKQDGMDKNGKPKFEANPIISGAALAELETETMRTYVISFNGDPNNAYNRMMETLTGKEYDVVWEAVEATRDAEGKK